MVVSLVAVTSPDPGYLPIRVVHEHILTLAEPGVVPLPPGEHSLPLVDLHLEIERVFLIITLQGMEPHGLPTVVADQRGILAGATRPWLLLRGDEDVTTGRTLRLRPCLDGGRSEIRTRTEGPRLLPPRG